MIDPPFLGPGDEDDIPVHLPSPLIKVLGLLKQAVDIPIRIGWRRDITETEGNEVLCSKAFRVEGHTANPLAHHAHSRHHLSNPRHLGPLLIASLVIRQLQEGTCNQREKKIEKCQRAGKEKSHFLVLFHMTR